MDEMTNPFEEGNTLGAAISFIAASIAAIGWWLKKLDLRIVKGGSDLVDQQQDAIHELREFRKDMAERLMALETDLKAIQEGNIRHDESLNHAWERLKDHDRRLENMGR